MKRLLVVGASGHGRVVVEAARLNAAVEVLGFLDRDLPTGTFVLGVPVLGSEETLALVREEKGVDALVIAIGDNATRQRVAKMLENQWPRCPFATIVHPAAHVARSAHIGPGTVILANAVVGTGADIGAHCIINTCASADHDCSMADFSSLAPGVILGGSVHVGAFSAICLGARAIHGVEIGEDTVVGAGSTVVANVPARVVAYGSPCRVVRGRRREDRYL